MITLNVEPRVTLSWDEFKIFRPRHSIALDGFVTDSTKRDPKGPYANFDHHSHVDRISTRSTAEQVHMEINMGLFDTFKKNGIPHAEIFVNDCDEDTILATWLLQNHERVRNHADPAINRLVYCNDRLDCTGGAYPFGDTVQLRKMAWIFEPYRKSREDKRLFTASSSDMRAIMESSFRRIDAYTTGSAQELPIESFFEVLEKGDGWCMVKEFSTLARMVMFSSGISAFISVLSPGRYVIARRSTWTPFPIEDLYEALNKEEKFRVWGGSNTIGGSLREKKSGLSPSKLFNFVQQFVRCSKESLNKAPPTLQIKSNGLEV